MGAYMDIIFGGKFESALIRSVDEVIQPPRNASTHEYYAGLNRFTPRPYFERCGTFIALATRILVPVVDWNYPYTPERRGALANIDLGITSTSEGGDEWDKDTRAFVRMILRARVLSASSRRHIDDLSLDHYPPEKRKQIEARAKGYKGAVAEHYLCRLFLQLRATRVTGALVVLDEADLKILKEIGEAVAARRSPTPFDIPDVKGKTVEGDLFCAGLLNFDPRDIQAVGAVRADAEVQAYCGQVRSFFQSAESEEAQLRVLAAMKEAYEKSERGAQVEKIFEASSWLIKPLHYIPGPGNVLSAIEDAADLAHKWVQRKISTDSWHLVGTRMKDVATKDYLRRMGNRI